VRCAFNLPHQSRDPGLVRGAFGPRKRVARSFRPQAPHSNSRNHQFVKSPRRRREKTRIEVSKHALRLVEVADQKKSPDFKIARKSGVQAVAMRFEGRPRSVEHFHGPAQIARSERDFGLGYYASRAGDGFFRTEDARRIPQEFLRPHEIAKLRHRDSAKRKRRRIVAQRDSLQCSKRITRRESASRGCNQRIHSNPDTLVTPTPSMPRAKYSAWQSNTKAHRQRNERRQAQ